MCHIGSTMNMLVTVSRFFRLENKQHCPGHDSPQPASPFGSHELLFSKNGTPQRLRRQSIFIDFETDPSLYSGRFFIFIFLSDELQYLSWTQVVLLTVLSEPSGSVLLCAHTLLHPRISITHRTALTCLLEELPCQNGAARSRSLCNWPHSEPPWNSSFPNLSHLLTPPRMREACDYSKDHVRTRVLSAS